MAVPFADGACLEELMTLEGAFSLLGEQEFFRGFDGCHVRFEFEDVSTFETEFAQSRDYGRNRRVEAGE